jgi:hypothetical protein
MKGENCCTLPVGTFVTGDLNRHDARWVLRGITFERIGTEHPCNHPSSFAKFAAHSIRIMKPKSVYNNGVTSRSSAGGWNETCDHSSQRIVEVNAGVRKILTI